MQRLIGLRAGLRASRSRDLDLSFQGFRLQFSGLKCFSLVGCEVCIAGCFSFNSIRSWTLKQTSLIPINLVETLKESRYPQNCFGMM